MRGKTFAVHRGSSCHFGLTNPRPYNSDSNTFIYALDLSSVWLTPSLFIPHSIINQKILLFVFALLEFYVYEPTGQRVSNSDGKILPRTVLSLVRLACTFGFPFTFISWGWIFIIFHIFIIHNIKKKREKGTLKKKNNNSKPFHPACSWSCQVLYRWD